MGFKIITDARVTSTHDLKVNKRLLQRSLDGTQEKYVFKFKVSGR